MTRSLLSSVRILTVVSLAGIGTSAFAGISSIGGPQPHGSWTQSFNESGVGPFDHIQIFYLSGNVFDSPNAMQNFSDGSWSQTYNSGIAAVADGNFVNTLNFDIVFSGASADPLSFVFQAYNGNILVDDAIAQWSGAGWSFSAGTGEPSGRFVPTPGSLALLGLGGLAAVRRRRS